MQYSCQGRLIGSQLYLFWDELFAIKTPTITIIIIIIIIIITVLEPLERAVSQILIPTITGHKCSQLERDVLSLPVRCGALGFGNPQAEAAREITHQ